MKFLSVTPTLVPINKGIAPTVGIIYSNNTTLTTWLHFTCQYCTKLCSVRCFACKTLAVCKVGRAFRVLHKSWLILRLWSCFHNTTLECEQFLYGIEFRVGPSSPKLRVFVIYALTWHPHVCSTTNVEMARLLTSRTIKKKYQHKNLVDIILWQYKINKKSSKNIMGYYKISWASGNLIYLQLSRAEISGSDLYEMKWLIYFCSKS